MAELSGPVRIGNSSGFFGDRVSAAAELVAEEQLDFLTGDWLAELTMSILRRQRDRDPLAGFASTFLRQVEDVLGDCLERGIRIVSNAGGLNPAGCAEAVEQLATRLGLSATVGYVDGDDLAPRAGELLDSGALRPYGPSAADVRPDALLAANAYLGAWAIVDCLDRGAHVVVTGRVTDAAVVAGPAAHVHGWSRDSWDELAAAVVAGHVIECGAQATGGNFSFFDEVADMRRVGFPIAEISADGSVVITKGGAPGGAVTVETVTSQLLYEVQTERYLNPDVTTLLRSVQLEQLGPDRVAVTGVRGEPPPPQLKVSCVLEGGYRNAMFLGITGDRAADKAAVAEAAIWEQVRGGRDAFDEVQVDLLGSPAQDPATQAAGTALLRIAVRGMDERVVGRGFSDAVVATGLASYPGFYMTTPPSRAASYDRYCPALVAADRVTARAWVRGEPVDVAPVARSVSAPVPPPEGVTVELPLWADASRVRVPLGQLVGARSGDKGGDANLGLWVREPNAFGWLVTEVTVDVLRTLVPETAGLEIERHVLPNLSAVNFVIHGFLGEGVSSCLKVDGQAKGLAEYVRSRHLEVPAALVT